MVFVNSIRKPGQEPEIIERPVERVHLDLVLPPLEDGAMIRNSPLTEPPPGQRDNEG
jgi:hypothetical protein